MRIVSRTLFVLFLAAQSATAGDAVDHPADDWQTAMPAEVGMDAELLAKARDYALTGEGSGCVIRHGKLVLAWGDQSKRYGLKSTTKSFGMAAVGLAIGDGRLKLSDRAVDRHPAFATPPESNAKTGCVDDVTLLHLATHTAGFEKPGGYGKLLFEPGTKWHYSDAGPNWLAECVTLAYRRDVFDLLTERVFEPIGIGKGDLSWRKNSYRPHEIDGITRREFGSGISANVDAMARFGYLHLRRGKWNDRQLLPAEFVDRVGKPVKELADVPTHDAERFGDAASHYGLLWWNNADGTLADVPRDAYWSWGLYDSLIVVIPSLDLVVARAGKSWSREGWDAHYGVLQPFLQPLVKSVRDKKEGASVERSATRFVSLRDEAAAPYPPSPVFTDLDWAPKESIVRMARGGDNWPVTWGDDGRLYTAYGDGRGFEPFVERKLSTGLAVVEGNPPKIEGRNLRSKTFERTGGGRSGEKTSGLLMVDGVLYALHRNADNSRLGWSRDRGETWTWADWRFEESFGYPSFLNFGKNYAGARDEFVYVYSHDNDSAYKPADRMVLARVPQDRITDRSAYEFLKSVTDAGPVWTDDVAERGAVFEHEGRCYRSSVVHHAATGRYLWCQIVPGDDTRFRGGFGVYDAPEPWGSWTTVFFTEEWDVGPGETSTIPTKWIGDDGHTIHLVFSGDDSFSVRRGILTFHDQANP